MKKSDFMKPDKDDLVAGNVLPIYLDVERSEKYNGDAILLEPMDMITRDPNMTFIKAEIGNSEKQNPHTILWKVQRWKIKYVTGPYKDFVTAVHIAYFYKIDSILK